MVLDIKWGDIYYSDMYEIGYYDQFRQKNQHYQTDETYALTCGAARYQSLCPCGGIGIDRRRLCRRSAYVRLPVQFDDRSLRYLCELFPLTIGCLLFPDRFEIKSRARDQVFYEILPV